MKWNEMKWIFIIIFIFKKQTKPSNVSSYPCVKNVNAFAALNGVFNKPWRVTSSPKH